MAAIIGTWRMCYESVRTAFDKLRAGESAGNAVEYAVSEVEQNTSFTSVGRGGLPAKDGEVYLDAGWMDGNMLRCGAVIAVRNISSPVRAARALCGRKKNWLLCGKGAERFAVSAGIPMQEMRTEEARKRWINAMESISEGHDTVCVIARDNYGRMIVGTSTSGLFMKEPGRVGDTPIVGSGFYCDADYGAAAATGLGEEIMRGCLSYAAVEYMRYGRDAQSAAEMVLADYTERLARLGEKPDSISLITMDSSGCTGAATCLESFAFAAGNGETFSLYEAVFKDGRLTILKRKEDDIPFDQ